MLSKQMNSPVSQCISMFLEIVDNIQEDECQLQNSQHVMFHRRSESNSSISDSLILEGESYEMSNGSQDNDDILDLCCDEKSQQNQNIIKNILKGFQKSINNTKDKEKQKEYTKIYNPNKDISFTDIKKSLAKRIKEKKTRWNMKLKSIIISQRLGPLFYSFLINQAEDWLTHSKVSNLSSHSKLIHMLINIIQSGNASNIKTYKKK